MGQISKSLLSVNMRKISFFWTFLYITSVIGTEPLIENEDQSPEELKPREAKQMWPFLTSYYIQDGQGSTHVGGGNLRALPRAVRPPSILSASGLFSQYTQQAPKISQSRGPWQFRSALITSSSSASSEPDKTDNSSVVKAKSESEDLTLAASALTETLFSTEGRHAQRDNYFDLNSGNPNDVAPLDFPGPAFDVTPAGLRQSGANLNEPSTPNDTAVEISGVGRPPNPPTTFKPQDCCLFVFLDGSAYYFDDFMRKVTGFYRLMYGSVNGRPHYVARNCGDPDRYGTNCTYIWYSGYGWVVGVGKYIGQTKGVMFTRNTNACPSGTSKWRYLNADLEWQENGNIYIRCAS